MPKLKIKFLFILAAVLLLLLILLYPSASIDGAKQAIDAWLNIILPSLGPFCMATTLLLSSGVVSLVSAFVGPPIKKIFGFPGYFAYIFLSSALAGYPMGARLTCDLYKNKMIGEDTASRLICSTSTSGPLFITGAVAIGMLGMGNLALYILLPHYMAALCLAFFHGAYCRKYAHVEKNISETLRSFVHQNPLKNQPLGQVLLNAVSQAIESMLVVGGFMILFCVFLSCLTASGVFGILSNLPFAGEGKALIAGVFEMTTGCLYTEGIPLSLRLILLSGIISFGGLSIHGQTHALAASVGLKVKGFFLSKLVQGGLSALFTWGMLKLLQPNISASHTTVMESGSFWQIGVLFCIFGLFVLLLVYASFGKARQNR